MHLYSLTLQQSTAITQAVAGNFSAPKAQEVLVARGKTLDLLRADENGKMQSVLSVDLFGMIRSILPFRLTGTGKDYVVVGSDSGRIVILEYNEKRNTFERVHQETFGKTGCRRIVPGQYLAADPKGRAIMIGALEKQKFVYVMNRDSSNRLTISSPLEAHKSHHLVYSIVGVDTGFDNPLFAAIEMGYSEADDDPTGEVAKKTKKYLTFYELDLGLNNVVRKHTDPVDRTANMLISVPGGDDGPGGVLVCSQNYITYKNVNQQDVRSAIPRRFDMDADRGLMLVCSATHKQKDMFFFLVQSELGDLYKVTLEYADDEVKSINVKFFDTTPVANSICILRSGFLFVASEFANHKFYQFAGIGTDEEPHLITGAVVDPDTNISIPLFKPRALKNLNEADDIDSLAPIVDMKVMDFFNEGTPQLLCLCGRGPRSSLRILRHGLGIQELATSELPANPTHVWTVKKSGREQYDSYIIVSFANVTLVLSIGESIEEVTDTGFLGTSPTLAVGLLADDSLVQVHQTGIRHIHPDKRINEWKTPGKKTITKAAINARQVVIALSGGEVNYFELNQTGQLQEVEKKDMGQDIACLDIGPIPEGRLRSKFLSVGFYDKTVRICSLDPEECLNVLSRQALPAEPESLAIVEMHTGGESGTTSTYLSIGLHNGVMLRSVLDTLTGGLSDTRTRFLGARPVKLVKTRVHGAPALLALSSRSWVCYTYHNKFHMTPLSYGTLEYASSFSSEECQEAMVAISANTLRIFSIQRLGETFNQTVLPLKCTPRRFVIHPRTKYMCVIETDHNAYTETEKEALKNENNNDMDTGDETQQNGEASLPEKEFGAPKPKPNSGKWASFIRVFDIEHSVTHDLVELQENEAAVSMVMCNFITQNKDNQTYLVVGTGKDMHLYPRTSSGGFIHVYKFTNNDQTLELVHKTSVEEPPVSLCEFRGRLLAGVGNVLRLYDLGKRKLLRKCENKSFPNIITNLLTNGDRIYASDVTESFHFVRYNRAENALNIFADDTTPRWVTASCMVDYDTLAGGDKFGNFYVARLPQDVSDDSEDDPTGNRWLWERGVLSGAPNKCDEIIQFHVGDLITSINKCRLVPGGSEILLYSTIMGSIGAFIPFNSREDVEFFTNLEMHLRQENPPLSGRDHLAFRSAYFPVKNVVDGDLCEQFGTMELGRQKTISETGMDRKPDEVAKKLEDIRNKIL